jgi:hypothetical protein
MPARSREGLDGYIREVRLDQRWPACANVHTHATKHVMVYMYDREKASVAAF